MRKRKRNGPLKGVQQIGSNMTEVEHGDLTILYSYKTPVAMLGPAGGYVTQKKWSVTTSKHIGKFFARHGYDKRGAAKIPQQDLEAFAEQGQYFSDFPVTLIGDPDHAAKQQKAVERLTRRRKNPHARRSRRRIVFDRSDVGAHIDGSYGEEHAVKKMSVLLGTVEDALKIGPVANRARGLRIEQEDSDAAEFMDDFVDEWLQDGTECLQDATQEGFAWEWEGGDLILRETDDAER